MFFSFLLLLWMQQTRKITPIKKKKTNKSQNYNFTCVHQRPENMQGISETRRG